MVRQLIRIHDILVDNSILLFAGAIIGLMWANLHHSSYHAFTHTAFEFFGMHTSAHWLVNDMLMAGFFALAGKEVWEAMILKGGALRDPRSAATPILATVGGVLMPIAVYLVGAQGQAGWASGWAIPTATDIAFSAMVARFIFGRYHPAVTFLLLLAIIDDAVGIIIIAACFPSGEGNLWWLSMVPVAMLLGKLLTQLRVHHWFPYFAVVGGLSFVAFHNAGIHTVLSLLPCILMMPHAETDLGAYAREELSRPDTLSEFEHAMRVPVEYILALFGVFNAGVHLVGWQPITTVVLFALIGGKALGVTLLTLAGTWCGLRLPAGMAPRDIVPLGLTAGIGFTVALFVSGVSFPPGELQDGAKLGALLSLLAAIPAYIWAKLAKIIPRTEPY